MRRIVPLVVIVLAAAAVGEDVTVGGREFGLFIPFCAG